MPAPPHRMPDGLPEGLLDVSPRGWRPIRVACIDFAGVLTPPVSAGGEVEQVRRRPTGRLVRRVLAEAPFNACVPAVFEEGWDTHLWEFWSLDTAEAIPALLRHCLAQVDVMVPEELVPLLVEAVLDASGDHPVDAAAAHTVRVLHAAGVRTICATNSPRPPAHRERTLTAAGLGFMRLAISSAIGARKPDPAFYQHLRELAAAPPEEILFVDDTPANVTAAVDAGMHALLLDSWPPEHARATRLPAHRVLPTMPALLERLTPCLQVTA